MTTSNRAGGDYDANMLLFDYGQATSEFININLGEPTGYNTAVFVAQADHERVQKRADVLAAHKNSIRKLLSLRTFLCQI